eukprot:s900_g14.t1
MAHLRAAVLVSTAWLSHTSPGHRHGDGWWLPSHSIERTLHWDDESWVMSAASMAMQDRILLMPAVADRLAYLWNRKAIESGDFEVVFTISGTLPSGTNQDGLLAFWLSLDDCVRHYDEKAIVEQALRDKGQDWKAGLKEQGYSMLANKPNFRGLALLFLPFDAARKLRQTIAAVYSDGSKPLPDPLEKILEESRTSVVTSNWLPTGSQAVMASTQATARRNATFF